MGSTKKTPKKKVSKKKAKPLTREEQRALARSKR